MQKLRRPRTRLGAARALLAGAAILAGAAGPVGGRSGGDATEDTALAIPRVTTQGGAPRVALPRPLAPSEAERIRRIFALQAKGDIPAAVAECDALTDETLLPHILADRYLGGPNRAKPADLLTWLAKYPDLPDAPAIYALLADIAPKRASLLSSPVPVRPLPVPGPGDDAERIDRLFLRNPSLDRSVHDAAKTSPDRALRLIARTRGLDRVYAAQLRAEIAQILFTQGRDSDALALALDVSLHDSGEVGLAPYIAGLAAWRMGRIEMAAPQFEAAWRARLIQPGQRSGAAFWAARAHLRTRDDAGYAPWMRRGAEDGRTFYGLLARRALGQPLRAEPAVSRPTIGEADVDAVDATPAGHRAFALLQVGQPNRAAAELQLLWSQTREEPGMTRSIMLVAKEAGLSSLSAAFAALFEPAPVHLPARLLRPAGGFRTDPALLYALARLESNFDPRAKSRAGARGMLQLMPGTVGFILGETHPHPLRDADVSLDLGQRYLLMLAQYDLIGGDLIRLLAGYNSGPGSLGKWIGTVRHNGDPLLFMESVPNEETRTYIPRALAYTWLYAAELDLPSPSLDELAAGSWPRFKGEAVSAAVVARLH